jgi:hypothetical protein
MRDDGSDQQLSKLALSIPEVVQASGIGRTLVFSEMKAGRLVARKCGRRTVVLVDDLQNWLRAMPMSRDGPTNR